MHPIRRARAARARVLVRADVDERGGVAVIRRLEHDHVAPPRERARHPQRQLVRLARGVDEVAHLERRRQRRRASVRRTSASPSLQVTRVGVEHGHLRLRGAHHARMAVPDVRHVVVRVEVAASRVVVEILRASRVRSRTGSRYATLRLPPSRAPAARRSVSDRLGGAGGKSASGNAHEEIRIGREAAPDRALAGRRHAGEVATEAEQVGDDLEMQMRRPAAIHGGRAERGDALRRAPPAAPRSETGQRLTAQVPVQREERRRRHQSRARG